MPTVDAGPLEAIPTDRCVAVGDGRAVVVRVDDRPVALANRCLHQDSPLEGGLVRGSRLMCPLHFWCYDLPGGAHVGRRGTLTTYPARVEEGRVEVDLPDPAPVLSVRERLLQHAAGWDRDGGQA